MKKPQPFVERVLSLLERRKEWMGASQIAEALRIRHMQAAGAASSLYRRGIVQRSALGDSFVYAINGVAPASIYPEWLDPRPFGLVANSSRVNRCIIEN